MLLYKLYTVLAETVKSKFIFGKDFKASNFEVSYKSNSTILAKLKQNYFCKFHNFCHVMKIYTKSA